VPDDLKGQLGRTALSYGGLAMFGPLGGLAGTLLGGFLFPPPNPNKLTNLKISTAQKGQVLPVLYGTRRITGHYIWYGNFQSHQGKKFGSGGGSSQKKDKQKVTFTVGLDLVLTEGVDDPTLMDLFKVYVGKDVIWSASQIDGVTPQAATVPLIAFLSGINVLGLDLVFYKGLPGQSPDTYEAQFTSGASQATGVLLGEGPLLSESFGSSGQGFSFTITQPPVAPFSYTVSYVGLTAQNYEAVQYLDEVPSNPGEGEFSVNLATGVFTVGPAPASVDQSGDGNWDGRQVTASYQHGIGEVVVTIGALSYPHMAHVVLRDYNLGYAPTCPNFNFELRRLIAPIVLSSGTFFPTAPNGLDVNFAAMVFDLLTNTRYGLGFPVSMIDPVSFAATFNYLAAQGLYGSFYLDKGDSALKWLREILDVYDGWLVMSQGLIKFGVRQPLSVATEVDFKDYLDGQLPEVGKQGRRDTRNRVVLEFSSRFGDYRQGTVKLDNDDDITATEERTEYLKYDSITDETVAATVVARKFLWLSTQKRTIEHGLNPTWGTLEAGDHYVANAPGVEVTDTTFQVLKVSEDPQWGLKVSSIEDPFAVPAVIPSFGRHPVINPGEAFPPSIQGNPIAFAAIVPYEYVTGINPSQTLGGQMFVAVWVSAVSTGWQGTDVFVSFNGVDFVNTVTVRKPAFSGVTTTPFTNGVGGAAFGGLDGFPGENASAALQVDFRESGGTPASLDSATFQTGRVPTTFGLVRATPLVPAFQPGTVEWSTYRTATLVGGFLYNLTDWQRPVFPSTPYLADWPVGTEVIVNSAPPNLIPFRPQDLGQLVFLKFVHRLNVGTLLQEPEPTYLSLALALPGSTPNAVSGLHLVYV